jgi:hypothetical protein
MLMAFNYRPKTKKEIVTKKKLFSKQASEIFEHVKNVYDETIILDPNTNFNKIKVPRAVQDSLNITQLKNELKKKKIDIKGVDISYGNGSGTGTGTSAVDTAQQENATRLYCEMYIEKGKFPNANELKKVYSNADDNWVETFESQAKAMKGYLKSKGYNWSRDDGIMPFVENIALKKCGVRTKDSWNPADIYCVKASKESKIKKDLTKIGDMEIEPRARLDRLNEYMRDCFIRQELIGISLKKLKRGKASLEESNVTQKGTLDDISIMPNSVKLDLDLDRNGEFVTGEMSMQLKIKGSQVGVQIRAFSGGVRESTQMDMTGSGAAAKLGKVSSTEALNPFLQPLGLNRRMGTDLPKVGQWTEDDVQKYIKEYNQIKSIKIGGQNIYWGKQKWEHVLREAIEIEQNVNRTASQLSAKLQCFQWVKIFSEVQKKGKLDEFLTIMYYGAKKEFASAGPFLKIS